METYSPLHFIQFLYLHNKWQEGTQNGTFIIFRRTVFKIISKYIFWILDVTDCSLIEVYWNSLRQWYISTKIHSVTFQKIIFTVTAMRAWNLKGIHCSFYLTTFKNMFIYNACELHKQWCTKHGMHIFSVSYPTFNTSTFYEITNFLAVLSVGLRVCFLSSFSFLPQWVLQTFASVFNLKICHLIF